MSDDIVDDDDDAVVDDNDDEMSMDSIYIRSDVSVNFDLCLENDTKQ